ncbi:hypothetical protein ACJMK2_024726 [Sinanodonta woodiana]|uniref:Uncharacterized protein n=1 Tax=Sinanodonta woodiana TaxID=1069815 RepID=A0ABD3XFS1_SINWO
MGCLTCTCRAGIAQDTYDVQWQQSERLEHEELPNPFRMDSRPQDQSHFRVQWQQSEPLEHQELPNLFRMDSQPPEQSHFRVQWQQSEPLEHQELPNLFRVDSQPPEQSHFRVQWQQSEPLEHQELPNLFRMDSQPPELSHFRADFNPAFAYHSPNLSPPNNGPVNPYRNYGILKRSIDKVKPGSPCIQNFPGFCLKSCLTTDYNGCIVCNCTGTIANSNNNNGSSRRVSGNGLNIRLTLKPGSMGKSVDISDPNVANASGMFNVLGQMLASGPLQDPSNSSNFGNMGVVNAALVFNPANALNQNPAMSGMYSC